MGSYSIRDLEKISGIKAHTIRTWEKRYGLIKPERTDTNIRCYCDGDLKKILNVSLLNRHGIRISRIARMQESEITEKILTLTGNSHDHDTHIETLVVAMIELDERRFEKTISGSVLRIGFEETILNIIYPFFEKIGILWQTGTINPAQEHFVSNLIRQKMIVAIDALMDNVNPYAGSFILFLPENELHELGLIFFSYMIKKKGHGLIYLGQSVPFDDLLEVNRIHPSDYLVTSVTSALTGDELIAYLEKLKNHFRTQQIYVSGSQAKEISGRLPEKVFLIESALDFRELLNKLQ